MPGPVTYQLGKMGTTTGNLVAEEVTDALTLSSSPATIYYSASSVVNT